MCRRLIAVLTLTLVIASVAALPALAASTAQEGYAPPGGRVQVDADPHRSTLPFTGLDVGLLLGAGVVLVAAGIGMARLTRSARQID